MPVLGAMSAALGAILGAWITTRYSQQHCTPNKQESCVTGNGRKGTQICSSSGNSFTPCAPNAAPTNVVKIHCPETAIEAHEIPIYGTAAISDPGLKIEVFVADAQTGPYWHQGSAVSSDDGTWSLLSRFGNPYGLGHRKKPPLDYRITALLLGQANIPMSITRSELDGLAAVARGRSTCEVTRNPEHDITCRGERPMIMLPRPKTCPYAAGHPTDDCDVQEPQLVHSPVRFGWQSKPAKIYAELYKNGVSYKSSSPEMEFPTWVDSSFSLPLDEGLYEFKVRYQPGNDCIRSVWFQVERR